MKPPPDPHYRHRFPAEIISQAVWLYHVFSLSLRDVELLLAERGVVASYETIRRRKKFGQTFAAVYAAVGPRVTNGTSTKLLSGPRECSTLAARRGSGRCARHPGSATAGCQSSKAILQTVAERPSICTARDRDR